MPTSPATISNPKVLRNHQNAFTLIELLVVILIIVFVVSIGIQRFGRSTGSQLRALTNKVSTLNKEIHHSARLKNKTYRLVLDFGDKEKPNGPSIYVESGSGRELAPNPDATPLPHFGGDKAPPAAFTKDSEILKKAIQLPKIIYFEDVEIENKEKPITEGRAYVYFFPQGLVQKSIIHLTDGKKIHWSLIINPLTASTIIKDEYVKLKDLEL
jgi:general secretion pathway protein H